MRRFPLVFAVLTLLTLAVVPGRASADGIDSEVEFTLQLHYDKVWDHVLTTNDSTSLAFLCPRVWWRAYQTISPDEVVGVTPQILSARYTLSRVPYPQDGDPGAVVPVEITISNCEYHGWVDVHGGE